MDNRNEALARLYRAAREVHRKGLEPGKHWVRLNTALVFAKDTLDAEKRKAAATAKKGD